MEDENRLINKFFLLQLILQKGDIQKDRKKEFEDLFNNTCLNLKQQGFTIEKIEKEKIIIDNPALVFLNNSGLDYGFIASLKRGKTIEPKNELLILPYENLVQLLEQQ